MKATILLKVAVLALCSIAPSVGFAASWINKNVAAPQSMYKPADCFYFTLEGVAEADPAIPGNAWFAIPRSQYGAKDSYALLHAAKLSGQPVVVATTGSVSSCGYAEVLQVYIQ